MNFFKQTCPTVGYQLDLPLLQNKCLRVIEFPKSQNLQQDEQMQMVEPYFIEKAKMVCTCKKLSNKGVKTLKC